MVLFWKALAASLLSVVLIVMLKKENQDAGVLLTMAVCSIIATIILSFLEPVVDFLWELQTLCDLQGDMLGILLKAVGAGLVCEVAGMICSDSGNSSLGKNLQMLTSAVILWLSIPIFRTLLTLLEDILGEL